LDFCFLFIFIFLKQSADTQQEFNEASAKRRFGRENSPGILQGEERETRGRSPAHLDTQLLAEKGEKKKKTSIYLILPSFSVCRQPCVHQRIFLI